MRPEGIFLLPFPPFPPLCWKASWIFCKLRNNVLGLKTSSQRHRLPAGVSQRSLSLSVGLLKSFSLSQYATTQNCAHRWPILQWEQGGTSHWHFWEVSTRPSSCFPNGLLGMMLEEEFLSVPGGFCSAPLSKATGIQSLQGEHGSTLDPWTDLWLSRILLSLSRKF